MNNNIISASGILGVLLFSTAAVLGGFQFENYSHITQYISEVYAIDTPHGKALRYFGFIPSGILFAAFALALGNKLGKNKFLKTGFVGIALFYGLGTAVAGLFPCDAGCNKALIDPSISQIIHNLSGLLTYLFVPPCILAIGFGLNKSKIHLSASRIAILCGLNALFFGFLLLSDPTSNLAGLYQRIIEGTFLTWTLACALALREK